MLTGIIEYIKYENLRNEYSQTHTEWEILSKSERRGWISFERHSLF